MTTEIEVSGIEFEQGGRKVYSLTPTVAEVLQMVPERATPDVIQDANRRLYEPHAREFGEYLLREPQWISGAMMAGVATQAVKYDDRRHRVTLDASDLTFIKLFDGQHRRRGIEYALAKNMEEIENLTARLTASPNPDELKDEIEDKKEWAETFVNQTVPLLLYVEDDLIALQQMYADISHVRVPDAITVARFDKRDPFNTAALELADTHKALKNLVEMEKNTLGQRADAVLTLNQLAAVLRTLFAGVGGRVGRVATTVDPREVVSRGADFFDDLMNASDALSAVAEGRARPSDLRANGELTINVTMMKIMAAIWRDLAIVKGHERKDVTTFLETLPHTPSADKDSIWVRAGVLPATDEKVTPYGRAQESRKAVQTAAEVYEELAA
jgi:DGQHR domain-containing protein